MRFRNVLAGAFRGAPARATIGVLERVARAPRDGFAVLTYHRVDDPGHRPWLYPPLLSATPERFEAQVRSIISRYRPITLPDVLAAQRGARPLPDRALLVTFDDAYADFREVAWPILRGFGVAPTLFVPTAFATRRGEPFWWDRLWNAVRTASGDFIDTPIGRLPVREEGERRQAAKALVDHCKGLEHEAAVGLALELAQRLAADGGGPREPSVLGWDALRALAAEGVHIAPHTRTHPVLTRVGHERLIAELADSRRDIERELGDAGYPSAFAYPAGRHDDRTRRALSDAGFELGFTTDRGTNQVGRSDPLRLRRVNVGFRAGAELLRAELAVFAFDTSRYRAGEV